MQGEFPCAAGGKHRIPDCLHYLLHVRFCKSINQALRETILKFFDGFSGFCILKEHNTSITCRIETLHGGSVN